MPKKNQPSAAFSIAMLLWSDRKVLLAALIAIAAIYAFALREPFSIMQCHAHAETTARTLLKQRLANNPTNTQLQAAAQNNLYANEDYDPALKKCMKGRGYIL